MFPDSAFAVPVPSFPDPVPLVEVDPQAEPLVYIGLNCAWFPVILGALKQLLLQTTWDTTDPDALNLVQARVFTLMAAFDCERLPTLTELQGVAGSGEEGDCMCCLRVQNGVLQQLKCGVWEDVPGQPKGGFNGNSQPGEGTPQPQPGGGCQQYHATLPGNGQWLLPAVVSSGDTLEITGATGVFYEGGSALWYCPDGSEFFAGICTGVTVTSGSSQMPSVHVGRIIAKIGATYYDVQPGIFTVPSGHTNDQVTFVQNTSNLAGSGGSVGFDVQVCNNAAAPWTSHFDFTTNPYTSLITMLNGNWSPGVGYDGIVSGVPGEGMALYFQFNATGVQTTSMKAIYDASNQVGSNQAEAFFDSHGYYTANQNGNIGTGLILFTGHVQTLDNPAIQIITGDPAATAHVESMTITGTGTKPAGWP